MQVNLLSIKHFKKVALTSVIMMLLIFMFLMAMVPFSTANEDASTMQALGPGKIPTIDGIWSAGEWDDALEYSATNSTLTSYVRVKWNGSFLYILIDSPWDTTNSSLYPYENTWIAFDTMNSHGSTPQIGDYLFSVSTMVAYWGNGTRWNTMLAPSGLKAQSSSSDEWGPGVQPSPKNSTPHRIDEFRVPLTYVGQTNQTGGFYFLVIDDTASAHAYVEWPVGAGGNSLGWPVGSSYSDPCPAPSAWGHLNFLHRPTAAFTWDPPNPDVTDVVTFNATTSYDFDGTIANYTWNWGDSSSNVTANPIIGHIFSTAGSYNVNLTVTDNTSLENSVFDTVNVYAPREAHFSFWPSTPNVGDAVAFNASLSKDPGGAIDNYTWHFDDGNITTVNAPAYTILHIFSTAGSYNVNLTVTDNDGLNCSVVHTVNVGIPVVQATVPHSTTIPIIDGNWTGTEWDDAPEYNITGSGGTGYIRVKHNGSHLFVIIDSVWDSTLKSGFGSFEGTYVAFDTEHDKSTVGPQLDDYLFFCGYSAWINAWVGNGTQWTRIYETGYNGTQGLGPSPNNATPHRIDEMSVPVAYVGSVGSTGGFYVIVRDDSSWTDTTYTDWVEWPSGAGGDSCGWPVPPDYIDPCPTVDKWGYLLLEPLMKIASNITLGISSSSITLGESVTVSGTVSNSTGAIAGVAVTIQYKTGTTAWTNITTVTTDSTGSYTYDWTPTKAGTYEIKASWAGDADTYGAESEVKTLEVASGPIPILVIVAALAVVAVVVAIAVYLLKVRKPKR